MKEYGASHLKNCFLLRFFLGQAVNNEGAEHVATDFLVRAVACGYDLLGDPESLLAGLDCILSG
jgi:hypothetical protein